MRQVIDRTWFTGNAGLRHVGGGLHDGLPAALVSESSAAAVGFSGPVLEASARTAVDGLYEALGNGAAGEAVTRVQPRHSSDA